MLSIIVTKKNNSKKFFPIALVINASIISLFLNPLQLYCIERLLKSTYQGPQSLKVWEKSTCLQKIALQSPSKF